MTEAFYKLTITVKRIFSDSYIITTDEICLPTIKSCLGFIESCSKSGDYVDVTVDNVEIKRMKAYDSVTI